LPGLGRAGHVIAVHGHVEHEAQPHRFGDGLTPGQPVAVHDQFCEPDLLTAPVEVFARTRLPDGSVPYEVRIRAAAEQVDAGVFTLRAPFGLAALAAADTIVLPGCADLTAPVPDDVLDALRQTAAGSTRIASICTGAFTFAATGMLDGLRVTAHWAAAPALASRYPAVRVDPDVLYVDNRQFLTSAGAAAGLDLCLHLIRRDHGSAVAAGATSRPTRA